MDGQRSCDREEGTSYDRSCLSWQPTMRSKLGPKYNSATTTRDSISWHHGEAQYFPGPARCNVVDKKSYHDPNEINFSTNVFLLA